LGTVTSVAASVPSFLSIAGSPITTSGTLAISLSGTALPTTSGGTGLTSFTANGVVYASSSSALATGSALVFDGANLGVGVTPSAWASVTFKAIQIGSGVGVGGLIGRVDNVNNLDVGLNWVYTGGASRTYIASSFASSYEQSSGQHAWYTAPSGTAGNAISFTQAMTLTAGANLLVGYTSGNEVTKIETPSISIGQTGTASTTAKVRFAPAQAGYNVMGIYNSSNASGGGLVFTTGDSATNASNANLMTILDSGNVGIGTSSPSYRLHVRGPDATANLVVGNTTEGTQFEVLTYQDDRVILRANDSSNLARSLAFETGTSERGRFTDVGVFQAGTIQAIGTAVGSFGASRWFTQVEDSVTTRTYFCGSNSSTYGSWEIYNATSTGTPLLAVAYTSDYTRFMRPSSTSEAMRIANTGNVGIGTNNPIGKLTIDVPDTLVSPTLSMRNAGNTYGFDFDSETVSTGRLDLYAVNNSVRSHVMTWLRGSGNVGIGNIAPTGNLHIGNGSTVAEQNLYVQSDAANRPYLRLWGGTTNKLEMHIGSTANITTVSATDLVFSTNNTERARIDTSGNFLIGSTSTAGTNAPTAITVAGRLRSVAAGTSSIANGATVDIALTMPRTIVSYYIVSDGNSNNMSVGFFRANDNGASSNYTLFSQSESNVAVTSPSAGIIRITNNTGGSSAFNYAFTVLSGT
jgi:hypothetical protein